MFCKIRAKISNSADNLGFLIGGTIEVANGITNLGEPPILDWPGILGLTVSKDAHTHTALGLVEDDEYRACRRLFA